MQNSDMADHVQEAHKPHAVCVPYPAQGHINPMLKLAILLHHKGFFVTFVNTEHIQKLLLKSKGPNSLNSLQDFQFETIPDGLPPRDAETFQDTFSLCDSTRKNCLAPFRDLLMKLNSSKVVPPVTCIVFDAIMAFPVIAAIEIGVPSVCFRVTNARVLICNKYLPVLIEKGIIPLKGSTDSTSDYLDTAVDWIPTMENFRLREFPTFIRTNDINDLMLNFIIGETEKSSKASAIIINTFDALESDALDALSPICPPIYSVGPIHLLCKQLPQSSLKFIGVSLWKEEQECLQWLDSKEEKSVVYVNFGSLAVVTPQKLVEIAWGLANSNKNFLWIIRSNSIVGDDSPPLPNDFLEETREKGLISKWCPQELVLNHPSIGAFLTHCGWNSMVESLASGVPMICWPFFADQQLNCRCACTKWGVGMEIDGINVNRDEVEKLVREVIDGEEGKTVRDKAIHWKEKAEEAIAANGSSYLNFDKLVKETLLSKT